MRLDVNNLNFSYADKTIIKNLSFSVPDGAFISILGPSGCGKSTLLNVLSGLLKPQSGEIRIDDVPVRGNEPGAGVYAAERPAVSVADDSG